MNKLHTLYKYHHTVQISPHYTKFACGYFSKNNSIVRVLFLSDFTVVNKIVSLL